MSDNGSGQAPWINPDATTDVDVPRIPSLSFLSRAVGVAAEVLRSMASHSRLSPEVWYRHRNINKASGKLRYVHAVHPALKDVQRWILDRVLSQAPIHDAAHGFRRGRSVVTNATVHVHNDAVASFDLKDFFPSCDYGQVFSVFVGMGYKRGVARALAMLCVARRTEEVEFAGITVRRSVGPLSLPQGAVTSPALSNVCCFGLDVRLSGLAEACGLKYSRYADDLSFSGPLTTPGLFGGLESRVGQICRSQGFTLNGDKTRLMYRGSAQKVTGVLVNDGVKCDRERVRRVKRIVRACLREGVDSQANGPLTVFLDWLRGNIAFIGMVQPELGHILNCDLRCAVMRRTGEGPPPGHSQS